MNPHQDARPSTIFSLLALGLVGVGLIEGGTIAWLVAADGIEDTYSLIRSPLVMLMLWVAVVLTVLSDAIHQWARYAVAIAAVVAASFRSGLVIVAANVVQLGDPLIDFLWTLAPVVGPLLLASWSIVDALRRRDAARDRRGAAVPALPAIFPLPLHGGPASPTTPTTNGHPRQHTASPVSEPTWRSVTSPWPRAVEDDPDGTLIRPPRRRVAR